jgi:hypothetical protein
LARVLKQCGHCVTIFFTPMPSNVSMFCMASIWKMYSLPERRAGSPVHISEGPRIANDTPARCIRRAIACVTFLFLSSNEPAQPTQYRYSASSGLDPSMMSMPSSFDAQSARSAWLMPHGFPEFSIDRYALPSSVGKFDSMSDR